MPLIPLRIQFGQSSPGDLMVEVQDRSIEYLLGLSIPKNVRVSCYLDRDWSRVESAYGELVIDGCSHDHLVLRVYPGSRTRTGIQLPGPMKIGEQLTLEVERQLKPNLVSPDSQNQ